MSWCFSPCEAFFDGGRYSPRHIDRRIAQGLRRPHGEAQPQRATMPVFRETGNKGDCHSGWAGAPGKARPKQSQSGDVMTKQVSVIGAGTIGASWAAYFLARGLAVNAYDPAPNGEAFARRFIDNAWPTLEKLKVVVPGADRKQFAFFTDPGEAAKGAEFVQESGPEREDLKI